MAATVAVAPAHAALLTLELVFPVARWPHVPALQVHTAAPQSIIEEQIAVQATPSLGHVSLPLSTHVVPWQPQLFGTQSDACEHDVGRAAGAVVETSRWPHCPCALQVHTERPQSIAVEHTAVQATPPLGHVSLPFHTHVVPWQPQLFGTQSDACEHVCASAVRAASAVHTSATATVVKGIRMLFW